jgi:hypothetical protein
MREEQCTRWLRLERSAELPLKRYHAQKVTMRYPLRHSSPSDRPSPICYFSRAKKRPRLVMLPRAEREAHSTLLQDRMISRAMGTCGNASAFAKRNRPAVLVPCSTDAG